jgi:hypothetical protein
VRLFWFQIFIYILLLIFVSSLFSFAGFASVTTWTLRRSYNSRLGLCVGRDSRLGLCVGRTLNLDFASVHLFLPNTIDLRFGFVLNADLAAHAIAYYSISQVNVLNVIIFDLLYYDYSSSPKSSSKTDVKEDSRQGTPEDERQ